jgi:serine/threonine protein kinase
MAHHLIGKQIGTYLIIGELGTGGFADVLLAEHVFMKQQVAMKVLHTHQDQISHSGKTFPSQAPDVEAFYNEELLKKEMETIASLNHPNIIKIYDGGLHLGQPYFVMPVVRETVEARTRGKIPLSLEQILEYAVPVANALDYVHRKLKLVHRDVKPKNLLIDEHGTVMLADFGIVVRSDSAEKIVVSDGVASFPHGTIAYMSPEQLLNKAQSATDQYSLGIAIYLWLSGQFPFYGQTMQDIVDQKMIGNPRSFASVGMNVDPEIERAIQRALARDPKDRFPTVTAFTDELEYIRSKRIRKPQVIEETEQLQVVINQANQKIRFLEEENGKLVSQITVLVEKNKQLEAINSQNTDLLARVKEASRLSSAYQKRIERLTAKVKQLGEEKRQLTARILLLEQELKKQPEVINQLIQERNQANARNVSLQAALEQAKKQLLKADTSQTKKERNDTPPQERAAKIDSTSQFMDGLKLYERKRYNEALVAFDRAITLDRNDAMAHIMRGETFIGLQRYADALVAFDQAITLDRNDAIAHIMRGEVLYSLQRYADALTAFDRAITLDRSDALAHQMRANSLDKLGRKKEAQEEINRLSKEFKPKQ